MRLLSSTMEHPSKWTMAELQVNKYFHSYSSFFCEHERRNSCMCIKLSNGFITNPVPLHKELSRRQFFQNLLVVKVSYT